MAETTYIKLITNEKTKMLTVFILLTFFPSLVINVEPQVPVSLDGLVLTMDNLTALSEAKSCELLWCVEDQYFLFLMDMYNRSRIKVEETYQLFTTILKNGCKGATEFEKKIRLESPEFEATLDSSNASRCLEYLSMERNNTVLKPTEACLSRCECSILYMYTKENIFRITQMALRDIETNYIERNHSSTRASYIRYENEDINGLLHEDDRIDLRIFMLDKCGRNMTTECKSSMGSISASCLY